MYNYDDENYYHYENIKAAREDFLHQTKPFVEFMIEIENSCQKSMVIDKDTLEITKVYSPEVTEQLKLLQDNIDIIRKSIIKHYGIGVL